MIGLSLLFAVRLLLLPTLGDLIYPITKLRITSATVSLQASSPRSSSGPIPSNSEESPTTRVYIYQRLLWVNRLVAWNLKIYSIDVMSLHEIFM